jgi:hypothetical protein
VVCLNKLLAQQDVEMARLLEVYRALEVTRYNNRFLAQLEAEMVQMFELSWPLVLLIRMPVERLQHQSEGHNVSWHVECVPPVNNTKGAKHTTHAADTG